jgi:Tfp pilus assembly protein FimT
LKKLLFVVALVALLALAAIPAIAQVSQENNQDADSGDLNQSSEVVQSGDNSVQCVGEQLVGNTGNAQTSTQILQYGSVADDIGLEDVGSSIDVSPSNSTECTGSVNQAASAS